MEAVSLTELISNNSQCRGTEVLSMTKFQLLVLMSVNKGDPCNKGFFKPL